jgi:hypothetical protein
MCVHLVQRCVRVSCIACVCVLGCSKHIALDRPTLSCWNLSTDSLCSNILRMILSIGIFYIINSLTKKYFTFYFKYSMIDVDYLARISYSSSYNKVRTSTVWLINENACINDHLSAEVTNDILNAQKSANDPRHRPT